MGVQRKKQLASPNTLQKSRNEELEVYLMDLRISSYWQHFGEWFKGESGGKLYFRGFKSGET